MKDQETRLKFVELRAKGLSFSSIAKELRVSKQTLMDWSKDLEEDIANLRAIELEALQEEYYLTVRRRVELLGERLKSVKEELDKRDLKEIPTEKLFDLLLRCSSLLKEEYIEPHFRSTKEWIEDRARTEELNSLLHL
ncbi:MAG: helix-turn-helix domain-containing protein [Candidatus Eisenbacteria bacterium]|nr:helix-turn-helix domain-containing protein [Candidatus Eisenbacteria bacterium]